MTIKADLRLQKGDFSLDVDLVIPSRGVTALFGRSGSGKSLILRCLAGLERAAGRLKIDDRYWQNDQNGLFLLPHQRATGFVAQRTVLLPHHDVRQNILYGWQRLPAAERRITPDEVIDWMGIEHLLPRMPRGLSGGECQRVAIGRALLSSPRVLLMDEPLSALDREGKLEILPYLERLSQHLSIPLVYVSHALYEVEQLADHMLLMDQGRITAAGPLTEMVSRLDLPVAHREDAGAIIHAEVHGHDDQYQLSTLRFAGGEIQVGKLDHRVGDRVRVRVRARDVSLSLERATGTSILNIMAVQVVEVADDPPSRCLVKLRAGDAIFLSRITRKSQDLLGVKPGMNLYAQVKSVALV